MKGYPGPNDWQHAQVVALSSASANIQHIVVRPEIWVPFKAGQHLEIRLTADDGYQASRSYSIASPPDQQGQYELLIERLPYGEVSGFFHEGAEAGAEIEIKGPVGGHFVWEDDVTNPVLMIAGGSGIAPILSMVRHRCRHHQAVPLVLIYATRYANELVALEELRSSSANDPDFSFEVFLSGETETSHLWRNERINPAAFAQIVGRLPGPAAIVYVCGSNSFAEAASSALILNGIPPAVLRTERFGDAVA